MSADSALVCVLIQPWTGGYHSVHVSLDEILNHDKNLNLNQITVFVIYQTDTIPV